MIVEDGFLSAPARGSVRPPGGRAVEWHAGAAYFPDGRLIEHSRRFGGIGGDFLHSLDQPYMPPPESPKSQLDGTHYYAGPWMQHFGHFLLETLPTLWAYPGGMPILYHRIGGTAADGVKLEMLRLVGIQHEPTFVTEATRVERMVVPSRPVALNAWCTPMAVQVWDAVGSQAVAGDPLDISKGRRVWLSRSHAETHDRTQRSIGHPEFDDAFASLGFDVVHPERLTFREQVSMARRASIIASFEGSALHLSAFAKAGTHVLMLGSPSRPRGNLAQPTIDSAVGNYIAIVKQAPVEIMLRSIQSLLRQLSSG